MDQRVVAALTMLASKRKLTDTLSPDVYHSHQNAQARPGRVEDRQGGAAGRCCSAEPHLSSTWRMKRSHLIPAISEQVCGSLVDVLRQNGASEHGTGRTELHSGV